MRMWEGLPDAPVGEIYPYLQGVDDGTWWDMMYGDRRGVGIAVWDSRYVEYELVMNGYDYSRYTADALFTPAFVSWHCNEYSLSYGPFVEVTQVGCYDSVSSTYGEELVRSEAVNLLYPAERQFNSAPRPLLPMWAVAPIDHNYWLTWWEEAEIHWDNLGIGELSYSIAAEYCRSEIEDHYYPMGYLRPGEVLHPDSYPCKAYIFDHHCGHEEIGPWTADCGDFCEVADQEDGACNCGLLNARDQYVSLLKKAMPPIFTDSQLFLQTWSYALDAFFGGWNRVWDVHLQKGAPTWFSSFWGQFSPFYSRPGLAPLVWAQSELLTGS